MDSRKRRNCHTAAIQLLAQARCHERGSRGVSLGLHFSMDRANKQCSLKKAQEEAASMTEEVAASRMTPEESKRLSRVRNIGIAVRLDIP